MRAKPLTDQPGGEDDMTRHLLLALLLALSAPTAFADETGWTELFDGKTLRGWRTLRGKPATGWKASNGELHFAPPKKHSGGGDLYTEKEYGDFVLELEWRIASGGNSGIKYRMNWYGKKYLGPEYQLLDNTRRKKGAKMTKGNTTGALYDLLPVNAKVWAVKPQGEWNRTRIVARGSRVEHWLNGKKVVDIDLRSAEFRDAVAKSKFRQLEGFAQNPAGRIMLQDHGSEIRFRKIRIREVPRDKSRPKANGGTDASRAPAAKKRAGSA